jgi:PleD family two-component response regulator
VAIFPSDGEDPDTFIAAADRAMYAAKKSGKGRVVLSVPPGAAGS